MSVAVSLTQQTSNHHLLFFQASMISSISITQRLLHHVIEHNHLRVTLPSLHEVTHHAVASVNSWLLETNAVVIIAILAALSVSP
jgi:hypothetical protein